MDNEILKQILESQNLIFNELKAINTRIDSVEREQKDQLRLLHLIFDEINTITAQNSQTEAKFKILKDGVMQL